jgi:2-oxoglutarate-Fe(II)-dependent oxygenase superfamily protein
MSTNFAASLPDARTENFTFDVDHLETLAHQIKPGYAQAEPFPHVVIDDFLPQIVADRILAEYPSKAAPLWLDWKNRDVVHQPKKLGIGNATRLAGAPPYIQHVLFALNSFPIVNFLEIATGIQGLIPDPHYIGGGLHQILSGGKLAVHADFNFHARMLLYRRINLLIYFNQDWSPDFGGDLELWDVGLTRCVKRIPPVFNRCVIFNTGRKSYHGHPQPLRTPEHVTRKSFALYYYTREPALDDAEDRPTNWQSVGETH